MTETYLPDGLPMPDPEGPSTISQFFAWLGRKELRVQRCESCGLVRVAPEVVCPRCRSTSTEWIPIEPAGHIVSWTRIWHPVHPLLKESCPYLAVVVECQRDPLVRLVGNLVGDPLQDVGIGQAVIGVFDEHPSGSVLNWRVAS